MPCKFPYSNMVHFNELLNSIFVAPDQKLGSCRLREHTPFPVAEIMTLMLLCCDYKPNKNLIMN